MLYLLIFKIKMELIQIFKKIKSCFFSTSNIHITSPVFCSLMPFLNKGDGCSVVKTLYNPTTYTHISQIIKIKRKQFTQGYQWDSVWLKSVVIVVTLLNPLSPRTPQPFGHHEIRKWKQGEKELSAAVPLKWFKKLWHFGFRVRKGDWTMFVLYACNWLRECLCSFQR